MSQQKFTFHYTNTEYIYKMLIGCFGCIAAAVLVIIITIAGGWDEIAMFTPLVTLVIVIGIIVYFLRKHKKWVKKPIEEIAFNDSGFYSNIFGHVRFDGIDSYRVTSGLAWLNTEKPAPSLHIKLQNGKKIRYDLNTNYYDEEFDGYLAFIDAFVAVMEPEEINNSSSKYAQTSTVENENSSAVTANKNEQTRDYEEAKKGIKKAKKWRARKFAIPASLAISLLILARSCAPEIADFFRDDTVADLRRSVETRFERQTKHLREAIAREGAVFLFTNDTTATARLYPNIKRSGNVSVRLLQKSNLAANIDEFLQHKDSLGFYTMLVLPHTTVIQSAGNRIPEKEGMKYLYFTVLEIQDSPPASSGSGNRNQRKVFNWVVAYGNAEALADKLNQAYEKYGRYIGLTKPGWGFKLYITASENKGTGETEFRKVVEQIKSMLTQHGFDNTAFKTVVHRPVNKSIRN